MMALIEAVRRAKSKQRLFARDGSWITAGDVRSMAAHVLPRMQTVAGPVFLQGFGDPFQLFRQFADALFRLGLPRRARGFRP